MTENQPVQVTASPREPVHITLDSPPGDPERRWGQFFVSWLLPVLTAVLATVLCLNVSERNAERGRAARAELHSTMCTMIVALDDNYRSSELISEVGERNAQTMRELRRTESCDGPGR